MNPADSADLELDQLIKLFYDDPVRLGHFQELNPAEVPDPGHQLLVHNKHMTVTVEKYHSSPVDVNVLQTRRDGEHYARKIVLTRQSDERPVMFGVVRLNLSLLAPEVRQEIEGQRTPLGRILIDHNVLRAVKLLSLFRIDPGEDLIAALNLAYRSNLFWPDGADLLRWIAGN